MCTQPPQTPFICRRKVIFVDARPKIGQKKSQIRHIRHRCRQIYEEKSLKYYCRREKRKNSQIRAAISEEVPYLQRFCGWEDFFSSEESMRGITLEGNFV